MPAQNSDAPAATFLALGTERLSALWRAVMRTECPGEVVSLFAAMVAPWGDTAVPVTMGGEPPAQPAWPSELTEDHTPFEFAAVFGPNGPALQILVEAQGGAPTLAAQLAAGRDTSRALAARGADLAKLDAVADLFLPDAPSGKFAIWHSALLRADRPPAFSVYLNPQIQGSARSYAIVEEALCRLGFGASFPVLAAAARRTPPVDELRWIAIDLSSDASAAVRVYIEHHDATADDLERAAGAAGNHVPGAAIELCEAVAGTKGALAAAPGTCLTFAKGAAPSATLHLPVRRYVEHDRAARERIRGYLARKGVAAEPYDAAVEAVARRPLDAGSGLHAEVSLDPRGPEVTVRFAAEAFHGAKARREPAWTAPAPAAIVEHYERDSIALHPFFQRLGREPVNPAALWLLMNNVREGMTRRFVSRLAKVVARIEVLHVRSILAKQLNDELGDGDATRAHVLLFDRLVDGLDALKPNPMPANALEPGRKWGLRLDEVYDQGHPFEGVGTSMVVEIVGKHADCRMADEFRRQPIVPDSVLEWLHLHEELEQEHSGESLELAHLVPADAETHAAVWRGARACGAACWAFLDDMYALCYGAPLGSG